MESEFIYVGSGSSEKKGKINDNNVGNGSNFN